MSLTVPKIDLLPEHLIDQIKAGEVIERPGNLLKEILENAIDAGSTKLELSLRNNGLDLIALRDNGHGMRFSDLPLAFSRHATSKISQFEDLYKLHSFGFRGEALASIASISKLQCISQASGSSEASEIRIHGGETVLHEKRLGVAQGTELIIQDLFYNTPARLKFIQSQSSEKQFIKRVIFSFVLSNPDVDFHVKWDDDDKEIYPARQSLVERIKDIVPKAAPSLLHSYRAYESNELDVFLIPSQFKTPIKWQYVFINNRLILDKQFHRVMSNSLQAGFGQDDFHYIAFFKLPADAIDVNVHPSKTTIKCMESSKLMGLLTSTIREMNAVKKPTPEVAPGPVMSFIPESEQTLHQERHEYNMEGLFSPHTLVRDEVKTGLEWIEDEFILLETHAYSAKKLLWHFVQAKLETISTTIPLMVSEPYPSKGISELTIRKLVHSGLELERLGSETLVLRAIPEWMNGFPLRPVVTCLLRNEDFTSIAFLPADWSTSTWLEILASRSRQDWIELKACVHLPKLLREKLK